MWIVKLALRRPYTFVVMAILILVLGVTAILQTPTDIFPNINIPVVSIIWTYNGLVPKDMSDRIVSVTERNLTTIVDNIEHVESQSLYGIAVVKVFLQPNASLDRAIAQIQPALKHSSGNCLQVQHHHWSLPIAHRACRSCSWRFRDRVSPNNN